MFRHVTPIGWLVMVGCAISLLLLLALPCFGTLLLVAVCMTHYLYDNRKSILKILGWND